MALKTEIINLTLGAAPSATLPIDLEGAKEVHFYCDNNFRIYNSYTDGGFLAANPYFIVTPTAAAPFVTTSDSGYLYVTSDTAAVDLRIFIVKK